MDRKVPMADPAVNCFRTMGRFGAHPRAYAMRPCGKKQNRCPSLRSSYPRSTNSSHAPAWERNNAAPAANNPRTWERSMPMMRTFDGWTLERPGVCSHAGAWERSTKNAPAFTQGTQERPGFRATPERCHDQIHPGRATRGRMPCAPTNMNRHHGESERQGDKKYMHS
jgi:hypothetical protein